MSVGSNFNTLSVGRIEGAQAVTSGRYVTEIATVPVTFNVNSTVRAGESLSGNVTLDGSEPVFLRYNPNGGNRDVTLVAAAVAYNGQIRHITNAGAADNIVVKDAVGTLATLTPGLFCSVICLYDTAASAFRWMLL